jgi:putative transposase
MTRSARGTMTGPGRNVRAKAGLNREIMRSGWGLTCLPPDREMSG